MQSVQYAVELPVLLPVYFLVALSSAVLLKAFQVVTELLQRLKRKDKNRVIRIEG